MYGAPLQRNCVLLAVTNLIFTEGITTDLHFEVNKLYSGYIVSGPDVAQYSARSRLKCASICAANTDCQYFGSRPQLFRSGVSCLNILGSQITSPIAENGWKLYHKDLCTTTIQAATTAMQTILPTTPEEQTTLLPTTVLQTNLQPTTEYEGQTTSPPPTELHSTVPLTTSSLTTPPSNAGSPQFPQVAGLIQAAYNHQGAIYIVLNGKLLRYTNLGSPPTVYVATNSSVAAKIINMQTNYGLVNCAYVENGVLKVVAGGNNEGIDPNTGSSISGPEDLEALGLPASPLGCIIAEGTQGSVKTLYFTETMEYQLHHSNLHVFTCARTLPNPPNIYVDIPASFEAAVEEGQYTCFSSKKPIL